MSKQVARKGTLEPKGKIAVENQGKRIVRIMPFLLCLVMLVALLTPFASAEEKREANRFNVVFVVDCSGSMKYSDPPIQVGNAASSYRYQAADLFLGLLTQSGGNKVGTVLFTAEIVATNPMSESGSMINKRVISESLREVPADGDTDIGKALKAATDMLDKQRDKTLPSVIVLLTDGKTETDDIAGSIAAKESAITACRNNGYQVFGVTLNQNNAANPAEVQAIVDATGGMFSEVKTASDLMKTFEQFYTFIYGTNSTSIAKGSGTIQGKFTVPKIGVDEVNIIIYSNAPLQSLRIKQPSDVWLTQTEIDALRMTGANFSVIKIAPDPMHGEWELEAVCNPGDYAEIGMVPNLNVKVVSEALSQDSLKIGSIVKISSKIISRDKPVTDADVYQSGAYGGYIILKPATGGEAKQIPLVSGVDSFTADVKLDQYGTFYATAVIKGEGMEYTGNSVELSVGNTAPHPVNKSESRKIKIPPFKQATDVLQLGSIIVDDEDATEKLKFEIVMSDFEPAEIEIDDASKTLKVTPRQKGNYSVTIRATDSQGASCEQTIQYGVASLLLLLLIIIGSLLLLAVVVLISLLVYRKTTPFLGELQVWPQGKPVRTLQGTKGTMRLSDFFGADVLGRFDQAKFVATGSHRNPTVYFMNSESFCVDNTDILVKKHEMKPRQDFRVICGDDELSVTYVPTGEQY